MSASTDSGSTDSGNTDFDDVVLVDETGSRVGVGQKLPVHEAGMLHRAISVFVFDTAGRLLLQRRAKSKYHFGGLWANTACSHPRAGEGIVDAGRRRLREEMGLDVELTEIGSFVYRAEDPDSGLTEHEYDHVLVGRSDDDPRMDLREADAFGRVDPAALFVRLQTDETGFVPWLRLAMESVPELRLRP